VRSIAAHVLLVAVVTLLVGTAAYLFSVGQPRLYQASAQLAFGRLVSPELAILGRDFAEPQVDEAVRVQTEAKRVDSFDVARATARAAPNLRLTAEQIAAIVTAQPERGTLVVTVLARETTPERAERLVRVYVAQYLALRRRSEQRRAAAVQRALQRRFDSLPEATRQSPTGVVVREQIGLITIFRNLGGGGSTVIQAAHASSLPVQPETQRNVFFGLLFGLAVGIGIVALRSDARTRAVRAFRGPETEPAAQPDPDGASHSPALPVRRG
jgi:capsular polysaccharide biosynthesis protein